MARPAIAAGIALAVMEALADFGAVSIFNFNTFTTAIYKAWFGFFSLAAAAQLASLLLFLVLLGLWGEQAARGRSRYQQRRRSERYRNQLSAGKGWLVSALTGSVFLVAFVLPMAQLVHWAWQHLPLLDARYWRFLTNSLVLAGLSASAAVLLALLVAFGQRQARQPAASLWLKLAGLGYALPGSVLAVGVMLVLTYLDRALVNSLGVWFGWDRILIGGIAALVLAYIIRFFAVALGPVQAGVESIQPNYQEVAQTLGASRWRILGKVYLPLLRPGLLTAVLLVFVDTLKEMPATLILRPFGWDTLAVRIFELTSEGHWIKASVPALTLVLASILPVIFMIRRSRAD
jgi:iron(III) transport system permease protein